MMMGKKVGTDGQLRQPRHGNLPHVYVKRGTCNGARALMWCGGNHVTQRQRHGGRSSARKDQQQQTHWWKNPAADSDASFRRLLRKSAALATADTFMRLQLKLDKQTAKSNYSAVCCIQVLLKMVVQVCSHEEFRARVDFFFTHTTTGLYLFALQQIQFVSESQTAAFHVICHVIFGSFPQAW